MRKLVHNFLQTKPFCVYALLCPLDLQIKYIGYTSSLVNREKQHYATRKETIKNCKNKSKWMMKLDKQGLRPIPVVLKEFDTVTEARKHEFDLQLKHIDKLCDVPMGVYTQDYINRVNNSK